MIPPKAPPRITRPEMVACITLAILMFGGGLLLS